MRFSFTPRGARLARLLVVQRLVGHGIPSDCHASRAVAAVLAELAANAIAQAAPRAATSRPASTSPPA
ncbi:hypothetical protein [Streptomyces sp. MW-W600-10]|uniref:hypothetical protein n=1 Tax=Streptomyces sp. MW-W600-10 TaxID=2829819 RepID=UPI0027E55F15|nr:hypothetical protein [Streptomyces sp. MW-W600-10]